MSPTTPYHGKAELFDQIADQYAAARPSYPPELISALMASTGLRGTQRVLEIGAGTGQLTVSLAEQGCALVAVERGPNLARLLAKSLASFPSASIVVADFDSWDAPPGEFDLIVAATAFHWLDPLTRLQKCASLLRPGGTLAVVKTHWGAGIRDDRFALESQACYARWYPDHDLEYHPPGPDDLPQTNEELQASNLFDEVSLRRYFCQREYSAQAYCDLLGTFSDTLALGESSRSGFVGCVFKLIEERFNASISRVDVHDLWLARAYSSA